MVGPHLPRATACRSPVAVAKICSAYTPVEDAGRPVLPSSGHHDETLPLASEIGLEELVVLAERHAAVRLSVRPEHVGVGEVGSSSRSEPSAKETATSSAVGSCALSPLTLT